MRNQAEELPDTVRIVLWLHFINFYFPVKKINQNISDNPMKFQIAHSALRNMQILYIYRNIKSISLSEKIYINHHISLEFNIPRILCLIAQESTNNHCCVQFGSDTQWCFSFSPFSFLFLNPQPPPLTLARVTAAGLTCDLDQ